MIDYLGWDSKILGRECGRIVIPESVVLSDFSVDDACDYLGSLDAGRYDFLVLRLPVSASVFCKAAVRMGFVCIEEIQKFRRLVEGFDSLDLSTFVPLGDEVEAAAWVAVDVFKYARFFVDPLIDNNLARRSRYSWVMNAYCDDEKRLFIVRDAGYVAGFVVVSLVGELELIGVAGLHQRRGWGRALVDIAMNAVCAMGLDSIVVSTQRVNKSSLSLYRSMGFELVDRFSTFHLHL